MMGKPCSGKTTLAKAWHDIIMQRLPGSGWRPEGVKYISTGDFSRDLAKKHPEVFHSLDAGQLNPMEDKVRDFVGENVDQYWKLSASRHLIIDGFPRNVDQLEFLTNILDHISLLGESGSIAIVIVNISDEMALKRAQEFRHELRHDDEKPIFNKRLQYWKDNIKAMHAFIQERKILSYTLEGDRGIKPTDNEGILALASQYLGLIGYDIFMRQK